LKKSLVAIAFLSIGFGLLLTTGSYATAPIAGSIPDFRTLPGENVSNITDLDHWAVDFDDKSFIGDENLDWTITVNGAAAAASKDTNNVLSLDASSRVAGDLGSYTFDVQDPTGQAGLSVVSQYQASTDIGMYPALSNDGLLQPTTDAVYTYVLEPLGGSGSDDLSFRYREAGGLRQRVVGIRLHQRCSDPQHHGQRHGIGFRDGS
jgi:hypothetical protein